MRHLRLKSKGSQLGFSLIELLLVVGISSFVVLAMGTSIYYLNLSLRRVEDLSKIQAATMEIATLLNDNSQCGCNFDGFSLPTPNFPQPFSANSVYEITTDFRMFNNSTDCLGPRDVFKFRQDYDGVMLLRAQLRDVNWAGSNTAVSAKVTLVFDRMVKGGGPMGVKLREIPVRFTINAPGAAAKIGACGTPAVPAGGPCPVFGGQPWQRLWIHCGSTTDFSTMLLDGRDNTMIQYKDGQDSNGCSIRFRPNGQFMQTRGNCPSMGNCSGRTLQQISEDALNSNCG